MNQIIKEKGKKTEVSPSGKYDLWWWILAIVVLIAGIIANAYYSDVAWALRAAIGIFVVAIVLAMIWQTTTGKKAWEFIKGSRSELRKVVWPTRQETIQTTLVVIVMVTITALILWGLDSFLIWVISWLTGQRG